MKKKVSVVVPCYNEEATVETFYSASVPVLEKSGYDFEIVYVNDGSADTTAQKLKELAERDERVKVASFSRNFGQQAAIICGFTLASGDAVIEADCDLQDPPELFLKLIEKWEEGYEVVHGRRSKRRGESFFKKATASMYYSFLSKITEVPVPRNTGDFKLYDRKALDALLKMPERDKYIRGLASWVGFKQTFVDYDRPERVAGETKYTLGKMIKLAKAGILSNSDFPLKLSLSFGLFTAFGSLVCFLIFIILSICDVWLPTVAWLFPTVTLLFSFGYIFNAFSNMYIARAYREIKGRPDYIIDYTINVEKKDGEEISVLPRE